MNRRRFVQSAGSCPGCARMGVVRVGHRAASRIGGPGRRRQDPARRCRAGAARAPRGRARAGGARRRRMDRARRHRPGGEAGLEAAAAGRARRRQARAHRDQDRRQGVRLAASQGAARPGRSLRGASGALHQRARASAKGAAHVHRLAAGDPCHAGACAGTAQRPVRAAALFQRPAAQQPWRNGHRRSGRHPGRRRERGAGHRHRRLLFPGTHRRARPRAGIALAVRAPGIDRHGAGTSRARRAAASARSAPRAASPGRTCISPCISMRLRSIRRSFWPSLRSRRIRR